MQNVSWKIVLKKLIKKKIHRQQKSMQNYPAGKELNILTIYGYDGHFGQWASTIYLILTHLTHLSLETHKQVISKQHRSRTHAAECDI